MRDLTLPEALQLGLAHHQARRYGEAEAVYRQILKHQPTHADALHLLGLLAYVHGKNEVARDYVGRATQLSPTTPAFWNTLGEIHRTQGRLDMAYHCYQKALRYAPDMPEALNNLGILFAYRCEIEKSVAHFERAIALRPDYPEAHDGLGLTLLMSGDLRRGWTEQEWRWRKDVLAAQRRGFVQPQWRGEDLGRARILIHAEQGFGDVLQFCRYVPLLKKAHPRATVIFEVPPELERLMATLGSGGVGAGEAVDELVVRDGPGDGHLPRFDLQSPLMSLPLAMGTTLETIPAETPYLRADREKIRGWQHRLDALDTGAGKGAGKGVGMGAGTGADGAAMGKGSFKVGIGWAGRPTHPRDAGRSMALAHFGAFAGVPNVKLISLQKGEATRQVESRRELLAYNAGPELNDFSDTAALVSALDLVIAVDTSLVHLAGALGKPFFVLLPFSPDWRWLLGRDDSPWYPTGRLFRQQEDAQWGPPLAEAAAALRALAA